MQKQANEKPTSYELVNPEENEKPYNENVRTATAFGRSIAVPSDKGNIIGEVEDIIITNKDTQDRRKKVEDSFGSVASPYGDVIGVYESHMASKKESAASKAEDYSAEREGLYRAEGIPSTGRACKSGTTNRK